MAVGGYCGGNYDVTFTGIRLCNGTVFCAFIGAKFMKIKVLVYAFCLLFAYYLGYSQAKIQIVEKQVEVIKYVQTKQNKIQSAPNASKSDLLKLMRRNRL